MIGGSASRVLVVTGGHPFETPALFAMFDGLEGVEWEHVEHPEALGCFTAENAGRWDAIVCYDMPGLWFGGGTAESLQPPPAYVDGLLGMLDAGQGFVFWHHALASWPAWEGFARLVGGRFHYLPGRLGRREWPDSGYAFAVRHQVTPADPGHPVCAGLDGGFELVDELYLAPVFEDDVVPLLRSDATFSSERFSSAALALQGRRNENEGWGHPDGSSLVAWAKTAGCSPIVYLQPGDGPSAYDNPGLRRVLVNAIGWVGSDAAHDWAARQPSKVERP